MENTTPGHNSDNHEVSAPVAPPAPEPEKQEAPAEAPIAPPKAPVDHAAPTPESPAPANPAAPAAPTTPAQPRGASPNIFKTITSAFIKPITTIEEEIPRFGAFKDALVLTIISVITLILSALIGGIFSAVCIGSNWYWEALGSFQWLPTIGWAALFSAGAIFLVSIILFGFSRMFSQPKTSCPRMLAVTATASFPIAIAMLLSTVLGTIFVKVPQIASVVMMMGGAYAAFFFYEGISREVPELKGDKKIYYFVLSTLMLVIVYVVGTKIYIESVTSSLYNSLDGLKDLESTWDWNSGSYDSDSNSYNSDSSDSGSDSEWRSLEGLFNDSDDSSDYDSDSDSDY